MVLDTFNRFDENRINPTEPIRRFYHYLSPITNDQTEEICLVLNCVLPVQHYPLMYNRYEILQWYIVCNLIDLFDRFSCHKFTLTATNNFIKGIISIWFFNNIFYRFYAVWKWIDVYVIKVEYEFRHDP